MPSPDLAPPSALSSLSALRRGVRRAVLRRRRLLAALLGGTAVLLALSSLAGDPAPSVPVPVAARDVPAGATLSTDDLTTTRLPPDAVPEGLVDDADGAVGRVLTSAVRRGEPLTDVRLVGASSATAAPGLVAVPVRLPDAAMVGLLEVGDRIALLATDPQEGTATEVAGDALVLAIPGAQADPVGGSSLPGRLVVVGVPELEVADLTAEAVRSFVTYTWVSH